MASRHWSRILSLLSSEKTSLWILVERLSRLTLSIGTVVLIARVLGAEGFGSLAYIIATMALFAPLATLGLDVNCVRYMANEPARSGEVLATAFGLRLLSGLAASFAAMLVFLMLRSWDPLIFKAFLIFSLSSIFQSSDVLEYWFLARQDMKLYSICRIVGNVLSAIIKVSIVYYSPDLISAAIAYMIEPVILLSCAAIAFLLIEKTAKLSWNSTVFVELLKKGLPFLGSGFAVTVNTRLPILLLGHFESDAMVGILSVLMRVGDASLIVPMSIYNSKFPEAVILMKNNGVKAWTFFVAYARSSVMVSYTLYLAVIGINFFMFKYAYGSTFVVSILTLFLCSSTVIWSSLGLVRCGYLLSQGEDKVYTQGFFVASFFSLPTSLILISQFGLNGAALSIVITQWFSSHGVAFFFKKTKELAILQTRFMLFLNPKHRTDG